MALFSRPTPERIRACIKLEAYAPDLRFTALASGVDNLRHDVWLSQGFIRFSGGYILKLFVKHSLAGDLMEDRQNPPTPQDRTEFRRLLQEVLLAALSRAKAAANPEIDLLANVAVFKYLGWELQQQYGRIVFEAKNKLKMYEGPRHERNVRAFELKQKFSDFQAAKRITLRRVSNELLMQANEVQADAVRKTREAFFGNDGGQWFAYFANPLAFTDSGRDDYIALAKYVMPGNFNKDPDLYEAVEKWLKDMLQWVDQAGPEAQDLAARKLEWQRARSELDALRALQGGNDRGRGLGRLFGSRQEPSGPPPADLPDQIARAEQVVAQCEQVMRLHVESYDTQLSEMLNVAENVDTMFGAARTEQALTEAKSRRAPREETAVIEEHLEIQRHLADEFYRSAQERALLPCIAAAYEAAVIYQDYCPPINPQQLKHALLDPGERRKVADMIEHYKLNATVVPLEQAAARVRGAAPREMRAMLVRFINDFIRYHRDARMMAVLQSLQERVNLLLDEKTAQLSRINNSLYEFLLPAEQKPQENRVLGHCILKSDVRDSTAVTAQLFERGLNPASHFSLNFFDPLNKLFERYEATKVFIEGDAVIVATFETENAAMGGYPMARICGLAREIMEVVNAYNARAGNTSLPRLDIGIGICWQDSPPVYLLDGETRIMISSAINLADRLSGCSKLARRALGSLESLFNVFVFQTITDDQAAGAIEEFLVRFNTGVSLSPEAFEKLRTEISLKAVDVPLPPSWGAETTRLYAGSFPLSRDIFQRLVIREAHIPFVDAHDFSLQHYTDRCYYEVCTNHAIYDLVEQQQTRNSTAMA